jgi:hypothetical protein
MEDFIHDGAKDAQSALLVKSIAFAAGTARYQQNTST